MTAARELSEYAREAFYAWEALRDARDEALTRCCELEDERDKARAIAVELEQRFAYLAEAAQLASKILRESQVEYHRSLGVVLDVASENEAAI